MNIEDLHESEVERAWKEGYKRAIKEAASICEANVLEPFHQETDAIMNAAHKLDAEAIRRLLQ